MDFVSITAALDLVNDPVFLYERVNGGDVSVAFANIAALQSLGLGGNARREDLDILTQRARSGSVARDLSERITVPSRISVRDANGTRRWVDRTSRLLESGDAITYWLSIERDVTSEVETEARLRSLFDDNVNAILAIDSENRISRSNAAAMVLTGRSTARLDGTALVDIFAETQREIIAERLEDAQRALVADIPAIVEHSDGSSIAIHLKFLPVVLEGERIGLHVVLRNVSEQKRTQIALAEQADRLRALYLVAAASHETAGRQIERALAHGVFLFKADYGIVLRMSASTAVVEYSTSRSMLSSGSSLSVAGTMLERLAHSSGNLAIEQITNSTFRTDHALETIAGQSFYGIGFDSGDTFYGAMLFVSAKPRLDAYGESDRDFINLLSALVGHAIQRERERVHLGTLAFYDTLTDLPNRVLLHDRIVQTLRTATRHGRKFALHYIDLDGFKEINERFGHSAGDAVLRECAQRISAHLRTSDTAARVGGDEFVVLQCEMHEDEAASLVARKLCAALIEPIAVGSESVRIGASIGIATFPDDGIDADTLMERADIALYRAKVAGKNRAVMYSPS